jgi:hypothetical protein
VHDAFLEQQDIPVASVEAVPLALVEAVVFEQLLDFLAQHDFSVLETSAFVVVAVVCADNVTLIININPARMLIFFISNNYLYEQI